MTDPDAASPRPDPGRPPRAGERPKVPTHLGFDYRFLIGQAFLPPPVGNQADAIVGTSRRLRTAELRRLIAPHERSAPRRGARPHEIALPEFWGLCESDTTPCHLLLPGRLLLGEELLDRHLLLVGPPGSGKTTQAVLPLVASLLADVDRTVIVFDAKGDQYHTIRQLAARQSRRYATKRLDLRDADAGLTWNPLRRDLRRDEAQQIAATLVFASETRRSSERPFWRHASIEWFTDVLLGLATDTDAPPSLPRLREVVNLPRPQLLAWLRSHGAARLAGFLDSGVHNAETCLADASMRLHALRDPDLCRVLAHDGLDLDALFRRPGVLVIQADEARIEHYRPVLCLLLQQLFARGIAAADGRDDGRLRFPVSIVVDEFASTIGALPGFARHLDLARRRRIGLVAAVQSLRQLAGHGDDDADTVLAGFASRIFFPGISNADADAASRAAGTMAARRVDELVPRSAVARPVYLPDEIRTPREHPVLGRPATLQLAGTPSFQGYFVPSCRQFLFRRLVKFRPKRPKPRRPDRTAAPTAATADAAKSTGAQVTTAGPTGPAPPVRQQHLPLQPINPDAAGALDPETLEILRGIYEFLAEELGVPQLCPADARIWRLFVTPCALYPVELTNIMEALYEYGFTAAQYVAKWRSMPFSAEVDVFVEMLDDRALGRPPGPPEPDFEPDDGDAPDADGPPLLRPWEHP